ncbi:hypothetical protein [Pseudoxanthomonas dokdonensis]|uniref:DUF2188 domain-containing protein n=1 Tax=Pseudoxanthomonas dokdonensis TaxID=344882 RepID=A0A0R0D0M5_9GAMM|nr:hypothetical protein [Pseudoxanthomonas dokdonensis]KRG71665.1 hypothetical protein ABB29_02635 [Pseudoxanthomonas dokdonensis]
MQRLLFTITANDQGWQLYEGIYGSSWFAQFGEARDKAKLLAVTLHEHHGIPTAVIMDTGRESVELSRHG